MVSFNGKTVVNTIELLDVLTHIDSLSLFPAIDMDLTLKSTPAKQHNKKH